ncbi:MAG: type I methionyl aminopeptidase [Armatimonadetes bacterium]|nr:type I methionyl aminopeptidase [Armatimonadota bacterium]
MIVLKTPAQLELMREGGRIHARTMKAVGAMVAPGRTTNELNDVAHQMIVDAGAVPSFLDYRGYPKSICLSVNEEVVHGIPSDRVLVEGDVVGVDIGVYFQGFHIDAAWTFPVGAVSKDVAMLLRVTEEALVAGIAQAVVGKKVGDISAAVEAVANRHRLGVVRELIGHGVGASLHEEPAVPNYGTKGKGPALKAGMTICIEPMFNLGTYKVKTMPDDWTIVASDRKPSAHFEHTVAITESGPVILNAE